jgi:LEA14-like dessication related protein
MFRHMTRRRKAILGLTAVAIVAIASIGILYLVGLTRTPQLEGATLSWGQITEQNTTVDAAVEVDNRLPFGIGSKSIKVTVPVRFYDVEAAQLTVSDLHLPSGQSTVYGNADLDVTTLPQWWDDFIQQGERLDIQVQPRVEASFLGLPLSGQLPEVGTEISIPIMKHLGGTNEVIMGFDDASPWEIGLNPADQFIVSPPVPQQPLITMESWDLQWGDVTEETTQILGTVVLRNELPLPIPIEEFQLELEMNDIEVVKEFDIVPTQSQLSPNESVPIELAVEIDNSKLIQWWTSHLQNGENSTIIARIGTTVTLPAAAGLGFTNPMPLPLSLIPSFECNLHTDIMGVINYNIAEAIGKPLSEKPVALEVQCSVQTAELSSTAIGSIEVLPSILSLNVGQVQQFILQAIYYDGSLDDATLRALWTSLNPLVATVTQEGLVTAISSGTTTIMAEIGDTSSSSVITVTE